MKLVEVKTPAQVREFLNLPVRLYKDVKQWIRPLDKDIEAVFDPAKNKAFQHGTCTRWILQNTHGETIGRVAAFVNQKTALKGNEQPTGGMGFFECINDREAAFALFDQCKQWLAERGMEAMDGPINFGNRDRWWGLLIEGFDREPNYQCNYNFPYYKQLFEAYGFQVYFYQLTFGRPIMGPLDKRLYEKAEMAFANPHYVFRHPNKIDVNRLADEIRWVYNRAWAKRGEIPELTAQQARTLVKQMKPILDKRLIWFGYYKDEPIAFFISIPELNQIIKHLNGQFHIWAKLKFLWHKWRGTNKKAFGVLFGVVPEHQGKGVDGAIIESFRRIAQTDSFPYQEYEMNWIGDFNPKMIRVAEQVTPHVVKRHATYRKLFDESKPFKRFPIIS
jgi:GNAT superfamily N-acetyltransferase